YDSVVSRTYYAMFLITEALLLTKNLAPKSHSGLISLFGENFVKTNVFSKEMGRQLNRAYDKRLIGDYGTTIIISKDEAQELLNLGQDFVENIAEYLEKNKNL
ncbi:MAG: HEPN domain-containing protein, partial [Promethearchaeota archaeon]